MLYKVERLEIHSENAAKPCSQSSAALNRWLRRMPQVQRALDYGCGKLRYTPLIADKCAELALVDSSIQLDRIQKIRGKKTTVRMYAKRRWPRCQIFSIEEFEQCRVRYEFVLCANVLSAIPDQRVRSSALLRIASALAKKGTCLFVSQYRNSYFKEVARSPHAKRHLDGWILETQRGAYYYGILSKEKLIYLVSTHNLSVVQAWTEGESAYVVAGHAV